jgi:hypothetical protein
MVSMLGEREKAAELATFSGGKEVCRSGCDEVVEAVESMEALRRLMEGAAAGISDCRRFGC